MSDPNILFEEITDEVNEAEVGAEHGEVPPALMEIHLAIEAAGMTPAQFAKEFGKKGSKK